MTDWPATVPLVLLLLVLLGLLIFLVEVRILTYAYRKVGVHPRYAFAVMLLSLFGSYVNIPLYQVSTRTVVALNVGGALIPILVSLYLLVHTRMFGRMLIGTAVVAAVVHSLAYVVPGVGIAVPMLVPPLVAAGVALLLAFRRAPPVAYVSGSMGTLIGADLLNLGLVARLGAPVVSIGGAGTFDGVFLTGILAGLLA
ncbi:MAG: hypothetical protein DMD96_23450 [Candidatus Rokuibacteriota bacterium]|nr:MAG: hypothetical protein DMD96_23450 [Candidatus Rokubacteria bacterium]